MRLDEITKDEFVDKLNDPVMAEIKKRVKELQDSDMSMLGWKVELRTDKESPITGEAPPTIYIYGTEPGTKLSDMERIFIEPILYGDEWHVDAEVDFEAEMWDPNNQRVEYTVRY